MNYGIMRNGFLSFAWALAIVGGIARNGEASDRLENKVLSCDRRFDPTCEGSDLLGSEVLFCDRRFDPDCVLSNPYAHEPRYFEEEKTHLDDVRCVLNIREPKGDPAEIGPQHGPVIFTYLDQSNQVRFASLKGEKAWWYDPVNATFFHILFLPFAIWDDFHLSNQTSELDEKLKVRMCEPGELNRVRRSQAVELLPEETLAEVHDGYVKCDETTDLKGKWDVDVLSIYLVSYPPHRWNCAARGQIVLSYEESLNMPYPLRENVQSRAFRLGPASSDYLLYQFTTTNFDEAIHRYVKRPYDCIVRRSRLREDLGKGLSDCNADFRFAKEGPKSEQ